MDRLIKENLEAILQDIAGSKRLGRRLINLAGFLGTTEPPPHIQEQFNRLPRLVVLQDAFDALLEPVTLLSRAGLSRMLDVQALTHVYWGKKQQPALGQFLIGRVGQSSISANTAANG